MGLFYIDQFLNQDKRKGIEIMLDSSGSVIVNKPDFYKTIFEKLKPLVGTKPLKIGLFNHKFKGFHEIKSEEDLEFVYKDVDYGGSDLDLAVESFTKDEDIDKILFTDGPVSCLEKHNVDVTYVIFDCEDFKGTENSRVITMDYDDFLNAPVQLEVDKDEEELKSIDEEYYCE